jgi:transcription elongation factor GreB
MSKAFTRDDDEAGFVLTTRPLVVKGPITAIGARLAAERVKQVNDLLAAEADPTARALLEMDRARVEAFAAAPVAVRPSDEGVVSFGAEVRFRDARGRERVAVLASADEIGLVPGAATASSPVARALLGARPGDVVELDGPRGPESLWLLGVRFPE